MDGKLSEFRKSSKFWDHLGMGDGEGMLPAGNCLVLMSPGVRQETSREESPYPTPHSPPRIRNGYTGDNGSIQHFAVLVKCFFGIIPFFFGDEKIPTGVGFL